MGVRTPGTEVPERAERIEAALLDGGGAPARGRAQPDAEALAPPRPGPGRRGCVAPGRTGRKLGPARGPGPGSGRPLSVPPPGPDRRHAPLESTPPQASPARAGRFAYDTMTLIGPGTWEAARGALDAALTAADLVAGGRATRLRLLPAAGSPRDRVGVRRLLLPEQRGGGRGPRCGSGSAARSR